MNSAERADKKAFDTKICFNSKNHQKKTMNTKYMKLLGPVSYYYYPDVDGHSILLLGDEHTTTSQCSDCNNNDACMDINEYLTRIIRQDLVPKKDRKCIDLFVETPYKFSAKQKRLSRRTQKGGRCKTYTPWVMSSALRGLKGRSFDISKRMTVKNPYYPPGTKVNTTTTGVICDERVSEIKLLSQGRKTKCIARKKIGMTRKNIINEARDTYLHLSVAAISEESKYMLPFLDTLNYVRYNWNICNDDAAFCAIAYPHLRYHYFDIRQIYINQLELPTLFPSLEAGIESNFATHIRTKNTLLEQFKPMSYRKIIQNLLLFTIGEPTETGEKIYDALLKLNMEGTYPKMSKQLIKLMAIKIQKQLNNTTIDKAKLIEFCLNQVRGMQMKLDGLSIFTLLIDIYIIARMFRVYTKLKRSVSGCKKASKSKNIIVYAGYTHINTYNNYFLKVHGIKPAVAIRHKKLSGLNAGLNKCIKIPHIQPFGIPIFDKEYTTDYE